MLLGDIGPAQGKESKDIWSAAEERWMLGICYLLHLRTFVSRYCCENLFRSTRQPTNGKRVVSPRQRVLLSAEQWGDG